MIDGTNHLILGALILWRAEHCEFLSKGWIDATSRCMKLGCRKSELFSYEP